MPTKRPDKQSTIYGIWDTETGQWWAPKLAGLNGGLKCAWAHPTFAKRSFVAHHRQRFDEQTRFVLVPIGPYPQPQALAA